MHDFNQWLNRARVGERYVYHVGYLPRDRSKTVEVPITRGEYHRVVVNKGPVHEMATLVMIAAESGLVHLVQRKLQDGRYQYIAEKR